MQSVEETSNTKCQALQNQLTQAADNHMDAIKEACAAVKAVWADKLAAAEASASETQTTLRQQLSDEADARVNDSIRATTAKVEAEWLTKLTASNEALESEKRANLDMKQQIEKLENDIHEAKQQAANTIATCEETQQREKLFETRYQMVSEELLQRQAENKALQENCDELNGTFSFK